MAGPATYLSATQLNTSDRQDFARSAWLMSMERSGLSVGRYVL